MKITSPILCAALKASEEFRYTVGNVSIDNNLEEGTDAWNDFWNDATSYYEVAYVESTFREGGHINCDERTPGMNFEHARLKKILKQFGTPELRAYANQVDFLKLEEN
jgi:hypothetical protein